MWDPTLYLTFAGERAQPFVDLLQRIPAIEPELVVDLGCGPGTLTRELGARFDGAEVIGVDSSAAMVERAQQYAGRGLSFVHADLRDWRPPAPVDVLVTNATLQWVPGHLELLPELVRWLAPGGFLALQVPGNFDEPSHVLLRELAAAPPWRDRLADVQWPAAHDPVTYLDAFVGLGCRVQAWETTYVHVLGGEDPVLAWVSGTALRPVLDVLAPEEAQAFTAPYAEALRAAYPPRPYGTVLPYRRVFAVAQRAH